MIEPDGDKIRSIAWTEVFPWLRIIRAFRIAISFRSLLFGAVAIFLTAVGWGLIGAAFSTNSMSVSVDNNTLTVCEYVNLNPSTAKIVPNRPVLLDILNGKEGFSCSDWRLNNPMLSSWATLSQPAISGMSCEGLRQTPVRTIASIILSGLWSLAVWSFFGVAICRTAAVRLTVGEKVGLNAAVRFAGRKWISHFAAPLLPIGGMMLAAIPVVVIGVILCAGNIGAIVSGIVWPLAIIAGFVMTLLLLGVLFGWPLMWGAISTEGSDSFDALSRSYAYLMQRPLHYFFYAIIAAFFGWLGWLLVRDFAACVVWMSYWGAGWGGANINDIIYGGSAGHSIIRFWVGCVKLLAIGYIFSYFWSASTAIYLLLRKDIDNTEMDEVFLENEEEPGDLPAIVKDSVGAPVAEGDANQPLTEKPDSQE